MSTSRFEQWEWDWAFKDERSDYDPEALLYNGYDMEEAFLAGQNDDHSSVEWNTLNQKVEALENLLSANVRVMKAEIKKEMAAIVSENPSPGH